ncbi:MAG TPA: type I restriction endonuclease subunit R, partial [Firmicutes bacterium]|nr:type I restriction endonuclease subunit R [Candidatus Fermentithermobacillaceae bacterium]
LSNILKRFNELFGNIPWTNKDRVFETITDTVVKGVEADEAYQNARRHSDRQNARIEHDKAVGRVITSLFKDDTELFKQFFDNEDFRRWVTDTVFALSYERRSTEGIPAAQ